MTPAARLLAIASRRPAASDAELLAAWATNGDADAFAELVRRYGPLVWRTCRAVAGDTPAAEDAFQAIFVALMHRAGHVTAAAGFIHRTAGRAARKAARRDRRQPPPPPSSASDDPLDRLIARELLAAVDAEIMRLPEGQRLPLLLCGVAGLSTDEAARRLGWTAEAVRGRLQRGRATVRARLAAKGLTVPAVTGLSLVPDRLTAAAVAVARGGPVSAGVAKLVPGGLAVGAWLKLIVVAGVLSGLTVAGGRPDADPPPEAPTPAVPTPDPLILWEGKTDGAGSGVWHPDGKHVVAVGAFVAGAKPHEVRAWDAATGGRAKSFVIPGQYLALLRWGGTVAVSPDGKRVAAALWRGPKGAENVVAVWDWENPGEPARLLPVATNPGAVLFTPNGTLLAVTHGGRLSAFRPAGDAKEWYGADIPVEPQFDGGLLGLAAALHPTADVLAVDQNNMRVSLWTAGNLRPLDVKKMHNLPPKPLAFSPDGRRLVLLTDTDPAGGRRLTVHTYDVTVDGPQELSLRPGSRVRVPLPPRRPGDQKSGLECVGFHPAGRFLAVGFREGVVRVVDGVGGELAGEWATGDGPVWSAAFAPDGRRLLATAGGAVRVWDFADKRTARPAPDLRLSHEKELDRFAGRWAVTAARIDGRGMAEMFSGGWPDEMAAVDPAVSPKAANVRRMGGPDAGTIALAIYEFLDADTCRLCLSWDADRRPTAFTAEAGSRQSLFTLKRAK